MSLTQFSGRKLIIATMHQKEKVIAPILQRELGVILENSAGFDTDKFGTFSGEIQREKNPIDTARKKCLASIEHFGCSLAVASEGSFGPHPSLFFVPADDELLLMLDVENGLEFKARVISTNTNFNGSLFKSWREVEEFAAKVSFPSHALIVRNTQDGTQSIVKGIQDWDSLKYETHIMLANYKQVFVETDMRAMYNPTRMKIIEQVTMKLVETIKSLCPICKTPGFDITDIKQGLPCELCNSPTHSILAHILTCQKCNYSEIKQYPNNKTHESPMYCDYCNP